jgi:hypothetical protein
LLAGFLDASSITGAFAMDRRDRDLLNKQLGRLSPPPRNEGMLILAIVAVFVVGMMAGASLFSRNSELPVQTAATETVPLITVPADTPTIAR